MSLTDLDAARAVADLYDPAIGTDPSKWLHLDAGGDDDRVYWALRDLGPALGLLYRGSILGVDWERDFEAYPYQDPDLGLVHGGMFQGMRKSVEEAHALIAGRPYLVAGHSLGAARALLAAALLKQSGFAADLVVALAPPKPGCAALGKALDGIEDIFSFVNGLDPVPHLPASLPSWPYSQPRSLISVRKHPYEGFPLLSRWHASVLYREAVNALVPPTMPGSLNR